MEGYQIVTHPFARGPMSGSAMEIIGNLHVPAPTSDRHLDARLLELGKLASEVMQEIEQSEAKQAAICLLVRRECTVPVELSAFATEWDQLAAENDIAPGTGTF